MISSLASQSSYVSKTSYKSTIRVEFTESVNSISEDERLEAFKKAVWKELDSLPWNSGVEVKFMKMLLCVALRLYPAYLLLMKMDIEGYHITITI